MTESQLNAFRSEFDPQTMAESLQADGSPQNKAKNFAVLKTSDFLVYTRGQGRVCVLNNQKKQALIAAFTCREELDKWPFDRTEVEEMPLPRWKSWWSRAPSWTASSSTPSARRCT